MYLSLSSLFTQALCAGPWIVLGLLPLSWLSVPHSWCFGSGSSSSRGSLPSACLSLLLCVDSLLLDLSMMCLVLPLVCLWSMSYFHDAAQVLSVGSTWKCRPGSYPSLGSILLSPQMPIQPIYPIALFCRHDIYCMSWRMDCSSATLDEVLSLFLLKGFSSVFCYN